MSDFTNSELAAAMRSAVGVIKEKGWIKGDYIATDGVCAVGAIRVGVGCTMNDVGGYVEYAAEGSEEHRRRRMVEATTSAVERCLIEEQRADDKPENRLITGLISFNDEEATHADDVTGLMERCAERLEADS